MSWRTDEEWPLGIEAPPTREYYGHTYQLVGEYLEKYKKLEKEWPEATLEESQAMLDAFALLHCELILFVCMTVEACLNYIGFRKLGPKYFARNVERRPIPEKVSLLFGLITHEAIKQDDPLRGDVRLLFDTRNRLVHPKCSEITGKKKAPLHELFYEHEPSPKLIEDYLVSFERILDRLAGLIGTREKLDIPNKVLDRYFSRPADGP